MTIGIPPRLTPEPDDVELDPVLLRAAQREETDRQTRLQSQFRAALQQDAKLAARAVTVAQELGESPENVEANIKVAEQIRAEEALKRHRQSNRFPATVKMMDDVWFAKAAHPDLDKLTKTEGLFSSIGRAVAWPFKQFWTGPQQIEQGVQGVALAFQERAGAPDATTLARLNELDATLAGQGQGFFAGLLNVVGQGVTVALPAAGAGLAATAVGTPAAGVYAAGATAFGINSTAAAGHSYWQMRQQGVPPDIAFDRAALSGVAQGVLETLSQVTGAKFVGRVGGAVGRASGLVADVSVRAARASFVRDAWKVLHTELRTELSQTAVDFVAQQQALRASGFETPDQIAKFTGQMWDTGVQTVQSMALLAGLGAYAGNMATLRYAKKVQDRAEAVDKLRASVDSTNVAKTAPELHDKFLNQAAEEHGVDTMYVRGEALHGVYKQLDAEEKIELEKKLPGVTAQMEAAIASEGDVTLPTAKVVRATPKLFDALKQHIRFDPEEPSLAEVQKALTDEPENAKALAAAVDRTTEEEQQWQKEVKEIEDTLTEQITKAGRKAGEARANATLWSKIIGTAAARAKTTPAKLAAAFPVSVVAGTGPAVPGALSQPSRGSFDPATWIIRLNKSQDASTAGHELFHGALQMHLALAQGQDGTPFRAALEPFAKWAGFESVDGLLAATPEQWEKAQEKGASAWETYLATGKAPTEELRGVFTKFMLWLRDLFLRGVIKRDELQPEVRTFFDNLLATESELALAQTQRGLSDVYFAEDRRDFTGTDEEWTEIEQLREALTANTLGKLAQDSLRATTFVKRLLSKIDKKFAKEERERRKDAGERAADEVTSKPVDLLRTWLKTSTKADPHKLNTAQVREIAGVSAQDVLTALEGSHTDEGVTTDAETLALQYGYSSAEQMLLDLATAPDRATMITERTEQILRADDPEFFDPKAREDLIVTAVHDEIRTKLAATVIRVLQKERRPGFALATIRAAAVARLENSPVRTLDPRVFSRLAGRAHQQALTALKEGRTDDAIQSLRHEMLHNEMARRSVVLRREVERAVASWKRFAGSNEDIAKHRSMNYVNAGRAILAKFGVGSGASADLFLSRLEEYAPDIHRRLAAVIEMASTAAIYEGRSYRDLSLTEFRQLDAALDSVWDTANRDKVMLVEGKEYERGEVAKELLRSATAVLGLPERVAQAAADLQTGKITAEQYEQILAAPLTVDERKRTGVSDLLNQLKIVEHVAYKLDGGKLNGWWARFVVRPVITSQNAYLERRAKLTKDAWEDLKKIEPSLRTTKIDATRPGEIGYVFEDGAQLLDVLGHLGSPDNKRIMLLGFNWATEVVDPTTKEKVLDTSRWDRTFDRLVKDGKITEAMLDYAQRAWDRNESLKAEAQEANKDLHDVYFKEVQAKSFTVKFPNGTEKTYRGGYAPALRDQDHPKNALIGSKSLDDLLGLAEAEIADILSANPSFTRERTGSTGPLALDPRLHVRHIDQVLRFIHMQRAFRDVVMLLRDPSLAGYLKAVDPEMIDKLLLPWLKDTFNNRTSKPGVAAKTFGRAITFFRRNVGLQALGGKIVNALQQATGISNVQLYVPDKQLIASVTARVLKTAASSAPGSPWHRAISKSQNMRLRLVHHIGQIDNDLNLLLDPSKLEKLQTWASESIFGYLMQRSVQARTDLIAWHSGYEHAIKKNASEDEAVQQADSVVRLSQGEHTPASMPAFQRGTPVMKLFFQFGAYNNLILNQIAADPTSGFGARARTVFAALVVPTLMSSAIMWAAAGGEPYKDEDHDGTQDDAALWWLKQQGRATASLVPIAGPIVAQLVTAPGVASDRLSLMPATTQLKAMLRMWGEVEREMDYALGKRFTEPTWSGQRWKDAATTIGMVTGLPMSWVGNAVGFYVDVNGTRRNRPTPDNLLQWVGGLTGNFK